MMSVLEKIIVIIKPRCTTLVDITNFSKEIVLLEDYEKNLLQFKDFKNTKKILELWEAQVYLMDEKDFETIEKIKNCIENFLVSNGWDFDEPRGEVLHPLRVALSGQKNSPSPYELLWALGKNESLERIQTAIKKL